MERIIQEEKHKSIESYPSLRHTKYFAVVDETGYLSLLILFLIIFI